MGKSVLFIAKLCCAERDLNDVLSKYYKVITCPPDKEMIASMLKEETFHVILIYLPDLDVLKFFYFKEAIEYAKSKKIPVVIVGSEEELKHLSKDSVEQVSEVLYKPISADEIIGELKKYVPIEEVVDLSVMNNGKDTRKHILVIDDTAVMLRSLKAILSEDYQVTMANSAINAIKCIGRDKPDVILLDYEMPVLNGKETLELLRTHDETKNIPVFFITGVASKSKIKDIANLKPEGYLLKPPDKKLILHTLEEFFRNQY